MSTAVKVHCEDCGHWKTRHPKGGECIVCAFEIKNGMRYPPACKRYYPSRLSQAEIDQARAADKNAYDRLTICGACMEIWWSHEGFLCPNGETLFVPLIGGKSVPLIQ